MTNFEIYTQWTTIQDIVGPAVKWLHLWYINGLNPDIFLQWAH